MAGSYNHVCLIGNVARDPEVRETNGGKVANFTIATSEKWKDKNSGEMKEAAEFHRIVCWNERLVDVIERFVKKGNLLHITGSLKTRKYTDQAGVEKYSTEIEIGRFNGVLNLLGSKSDGEARHEAPAPQYQPKAAAGGGMNPIDDDIPF